MAANETEGAQVRRGISYLIRTQQEDGTWDEDWYTSHWAIGLRLRCLIREGHSGVYQTRHQPYHLVRQRQTLRRESLLT